MRKFIGLFTAMLLAMAGIFLGATAASAHANAVKGVATCNTQTGQFDIVWTITNDYNLTEKATSRLGTINIAKNGSGTQSESGPAGTYTLSVVGLWSDNFSKTDAGTVKASGTCTTPKPEPVVETTENTVDNCDLGGFQTTHTTTTTDWVLNNGKWVKGTPVVTTKVDDVIQYTVKQSVAKGCTEKPKQPEPIVETHDNTVDNCVLGGFQTTHYTETTDFTYDADNNVWVKGEPVETTKVDDVIPYTLQESVNKGCTAKPDQPADKVTVEVVNGKVKCGETSKDVTTTTTTVGTVYDEATNTWVPTAPVVDVVHSTVKVKATKCPVKVVKTTHKTPMAKAVLPGTGGSNSSLLLLGLVLVAGGTATLVVRRLRG